MRKLIAALLIVMLPVLCWGQWGLDINDVSVYAYERNFAIDKDTAAVLDKDLSGATEDSLAHFWIYWGNIQGYYGFIARFDSTASGSYVDSITVIAAPIIDAKVTGYKSTYAQNKMFEILWDDAVTLETIPGNVSCGGTWGPTAERAYLLGHRTWWLNMPIKGMAVRINNSETLTADSCVVVEARFVRQ